jgi:predicted house-cleaning noncanonical NTP pyrophosphatase (MazG superfamily)
MKIKKYNKLIRDKIPEICLKNGAIPEVRIAKNNKEHRLYLQKKILEEAQEVANEKSYKKLKEEIADLIEVINCLVKTLNISKKEIEKIRKEKNKKRGSFNKRLILIKTKERR